MITGITLQEMHKLQSLANFKILLACLNQMIANTNQGNSSKSKPQILTLSRVKKIYNSRKYLLGTFNSGTSMVCHHTCLWLKRSAYRDLLSNIKVFHSEITKAFHSKLQMEAKIKPSTTVALLAIRNQCSNKRSLAQLTREQAAKTFLCAHLMTQPNKARIRILRKDSCLLGI